MTKNCMELYRLCRLYLLEKNAMIEKHQTTGGSHEKDCKIYWKQGLL